MVDRKRFEPTTSAMREGDAPVTKLASLSSAHKGCAYLTFLTPLLPRHNRASASLGIASLLNHHYPDPLTRG